MTKPRGARCAEHTLEPNVTKVVEKIRCLLASSAPSYEVRNVGLAAVRAELIWGRRRSWNGPTVSHTIRYWETVTLRPAPKPFFFTKLKLQITNLSDERWALTQVSRRRELMLTADPLEPSAVLRRLFEYGASQIPLVGGGLEWLANVFWPAEQTNVWDDIQRIVDRSVVGVHARALQGLLSRDVNHCKARIKQIAEDIEEGRLTGAEGAPSRYMNMAHYLDDFEKKFTVDEEENHLGADDDDNALLNYFLLPLYSTVVTMKLAYYSYGVQCQPKIGLSDDDVARLRAYRTKTLNDVEEGAKVRILKLLGDLVARVYNDEQPQRKLAYMRAMHHRITVHGLNFIPLWNKMVGDPPAAESGDVDPIPHSPPRGLDTLSALMAGTRADSCPAFMSLKSRKPVSLKSRKPLSPKYRKGVFMCGSPRSIKSASLTSRNMDSRALSLSPKSATKSDDVEINWLIGERSTLNAQMEDTNLGLELHSTGRRSRPTNLRERSRGPAMSERRLIQRRRNKLSHVVVYIWRIDEALRVGGLDIHFESGDSYLLGGKTDESRRFVLRGSFIRAMDVYGSLEIERIDFHLSDERKYSFGQRSGSAHDTKSFSMERYHIALSFLSKDDISLLARAGNIAVAYRLDEPEETDYEDGER